MFRVFIILALVALITASPARDLKGKIIGGENVPINLVPYQISLYMGQRFFCGGSIISKNFVLTAAHCVNKDHPELMHIRAGSADLNKNVTLHQVIKVLTYKPTEDNRRPDVALVEVTPPFEFDESHAAIPLFRSGEKIAPKTLAFVTGWGQRALNETKQFHLLQGVYVPMITKKECNKAYKIMGGISNYEICAVHPNGGKDACHGDSGGPLAINGRLAGIVSWGINCAEKEHPGVYAEVAHYNEWIRENAELD